MGAEWRGPDTYGAHLDAFVNGSECANRSCAEAAMATVDADPDYVYLPQGAYTVRGDYERANGTLAASFGEHPRYERAFENDGVVVFRRLGALVSVGRYSSEARTQTTTLHASDRTATYSDRTATYSDRTATPRGEKRPPTR
ncbi:hypothetical protein ACFQER_05550 [Halomicroarcula sp. GCM10025894]|uniref:hypothetical protein n=1 Tax=Halomicroarcula sp. GCM10025894 TaxID=3252673 RepID=UPI0036119972